MRELRQPVSVTGTRVEHLNRPPTIPPNWKPYVYGGNNKQEDKK